MVLFRESRLILVFLLLATAVFTGCGARNETNRNIEAPAAQLPPPVTPTPVSSPTPAFPRLQAELLDGSDKSTLSPIGSYNFKNYTYQLPRGWQNPDGSDEIA